MSFLVYDSVILRLLDCLAKFDNYQPPIAYALDTTARRWCRQHAPPASRMADPQRESSLGCMVCGRMLRGVMDDGAAKGVITLYSQIDIDPQPATIYMIVSALEKAAGWQEGIWLRAATAVGERLLDSLSERYHHEVAI